MTSKQKRALAVLALSAIVAASAALGVHCDPPDPGVVEDALGDESGPGPDLATFPPDLGSAAVASSDGGSTSGAST